MAGQQRGRRGSGGGNPAMEQLAAQLAKFLVEDGAPTVFPDQNPRGGGQPSYRDPAGDIRKDRIIADQAGQVAYFASENASLRRELANARNQRRQRQAQQRQQGPRF